MCMRGSWLFARRCLVLLLGIAGLLLGKAAGAAEPASAPAAANPMLHAVGWQIMDGRGNPVILRGVNLGGWMLWEGWMYGGGFVSESTLLKKLTALAGPEAAAAFRRGMETNFISEADFRRIAALGFNSVRVPVNYRWLQNDPEQRGGPDAGWELLDRVLDWSDQFHLYVILDLHAAPGGQSGFFTADPGEAAKTLWDSAEHQHQTAAIWRALAKRYHNRSSLGGYDLINEPAPARGRALRDLTRQLVEAVRAEDRLHLIFVEGGALATDFSMFEKPPDANLAYSFHIYTWFGDNRAGRLKTYQALARRQNVPLWVGEFGENNYRMIGTTVAMFEEHPEICGWCFWPWKRAPDSNPGLVTLKTPSDWLAVMRWIDHPLLYRKPGVEETRRAMSAFLESVKPGNGQLDEKMVDELLLRANRK